jgi:hypothetical protein
MQSIMRLSFTWFLRLAATPSHLAASARAQAGCQRNTSHHSNCIRSLLKAKPDQILGNNGDWGIRLLDRNGPLDMKCQVTARRPYCIAHTIHALLVWSATGWVVLRIPTVNDVFSSNHREKPYLDRRRWRPPRKPSCIPSIRYAWVANVPPRPDLFLPSSFVLSATRHPKRARILEAHSPRSAHHARYHRDHPAACRRWAPPPEADRGGQNQLIAKQFKHSSHPLLARARLPAGTERAACCTHGR